MSEANKRQVGGNHYQTSIQHWDYVVANDIPYLEAQVIKYLTRWRKKNGMEDVYKAKHYLDKLIEVEEAKAQQATQPTQHAQHDSLLQRNPVIVQDGHGFGHYEQVSMCEFGQHQYEVVPDYQGGMVCKHCGKHMDTAT